MNTEKIAYRVAKSFSADDESTDVVLAALKDIEANVSLARDALVKYGSGPRYAPQIKNVEDAVQQIKGGAMRIKFLLRSM